MMKKKRKSNNNSVPNSGGEQLNRPKDKAVRGGKIASPNEISVPINTDEEIAPSANQGTEGQDDQTAPSHSIQTPTVPDKHGETGVHLYSIIGIVFGRKFFILTFAAMIAFLAAFITVSNGPRYTATTLIQIDPTIEFGDQPDFVPGGDTVSELVEARASLLRSLEFSRQVAERLEGLPRDDTLVEEATSGYMAGITTAIDVIRNRIWSQRPPIAKLDAAARTLRSELSVDLNRRANTIALSFKARGPELSAKIANVYAAEYVNTAEALKTARKLALEQESLRDLSNTYGNRHPLVISSRERISLLKVELQEVRAQQPLLSMEELLATGQVMPAQPTTLPSSQSLSRVVAAAFLIGLFLALVVVLIMDRRKLRSAAMSPGQTT